MSCSPPCYRVFEADVRHFERYRIAARLADLLELPTEAVGKDAVRTAPRG